MPQPVLWISKRAHLYLAEGATALWSYNAEVEADEGRTLIDVQAPLGKLTAVK